MIGDFRPQRSNLLLWQRDSLPARTVCRSRSSTFKVPKLLKHIQEHGRASMAGILGGTAAMIWNKLMFEPF